MSPFRSRRAARGFTLLEVLIALTICGFALAALFGVIAGSKQLTFRARGVLTESDELRRVVTSSLLVDSAGELLVPVEIPTLSFAPDSAEIEVPERKTAETTETLFQYEIEDADGELVLLGTYWISLEVAE
jgi:prepilin-type N-terminal cleavage/methylation domain-containing protein